MLLHAQVVACYNNDRHSLLAYAVCQPLTISWQKKCFDVKQKHTLKLTAAEALAVHHLLATVAFNPTNPTHLLIHNVMTAVDKQFF